MRFSTKQPKAYCGIDLHARRMDVCVLHQDGDSVLPRHMPARPDTLLRTVAPSRDALVVAVAWVFPWSWLADLCAQAGLPFVLGHALSMQAIPGGKATHATSDAHPMAGLRRGGLLPQAYVSPAERRAPRDLWRRRLSLARTRAALLAHLQPPNSQDNWPESGPKLASTAHRAGVAERCPAPAVQQSMAVALALRGSSAPLLRDVALPSVKAAQPHEAQTLAWLQTVPGSGQSLRLVLRYAMHDLQRVPRGQAGGSSCRLVTGANASAGQRDGPAGPQLGHAYLPWAFAEAAVVLLRDTPAGQQDRARLEKTHGPGTAVPVLAQPRGRAVYERLRRHTGCDRDNVRQGEGRGAGEPAASLGPERTSRGPGLCNPAAPASTHAHEPRGAWSCPGALAGTPAPLLSCRERRESLRVAGGGPSPAPGTPWRMHLCRPSLAEDGRRGQRGFEGAAHRAETRCTRHGDGGRPASRVWCRHVRSVPAYGNHVRTRSQRPTAPRPTQRKNSKQSAPRESLSLDNRGPHTCWAAVLCGSFGSNAEIRRSVLSFKIGRFVDGHIAYPVEVSVCGRQLCEPLLPHTGHDKGIVR
jgi:hypothetical protein